MGPDENFFNSLWCYSLKYINFYSCFSKIIRWRNLSLEFSLKVICRILMFRDDSKNLSLNVIWLEHAWFYFRPSLSWFRLSSYGFKIWSVVSRDTFGLLADKSITILCCLSWYVYINCWSSSCLLLWYHCSWKTFSSLAKELFKICCCLSFNILWCLSW